MWTVGFRYSWRKMEIAAQDSWMAEMRHKSSHMFIMYIKIKEIAATTYTLKPDIK